MGWTVEPKRQKVGQALIYKSRWRVELFFKWIKQHLRIKHFYGNSENAVKTQIWIAVCVYVLVAILKKQLRSDHSLHTILQVLSINAFEKNPLYQLLAETPSQYIEGNTCNQLAFNTNTRTVVTPNKPCHVTPNHA